jgi:Ca-activated chloride channel family protein
MKAPKMAMLAALCCALLGSCAGNRERLAVMEGNMLAGRGQAREATASYLRGTEHPAVAPYADYGLGAVYLSLGETEGSLRRLAAAEAAAAAIGSPARELLFRSRYNAGVARYRSGDFSGAAADFRRALEADGSRKVAKRNLELSLRMLSRKSASATSAAPLGRRDAANEPKVLFDFIREKESDRWKSREWKADVTTAADY